MSVTKVYRFLPRKRLRFHWCQLPLTELASYIIKGNVTMANDSLKAPVIDASYRLIDFFTLELVLLCGLVLLALVLISRNSASR